MKISHLIFLLVVLLGFSIASVCQATPTPKKILVISSYHKGYIWSEETNRGFCDAMVKYGYFDNSEQVKEFYANDYVETSKAVVKKLWMDSKQKNSRSDQEEISIRFYKIALAFDPHLIFLGDDNAARYMGSKFLDTDTPIVFWGINNTPVKYGLIDSIDRPGHNVTGVYQSGYYLEGLKLLKTIAPHLRTFAILSDGSTTGRSLYKEIEHLARKGLIPLTLFETVATDDFEEWKMKTLELQEKVDAFFLAQFASLKTKNGKRVTDKQVADWYTKHVTIPEATTGTRVTLGLLCGANDSGYKQGFEAASMGHDIVTSKATPATFPPRTPIRGALRANTHRAKTLGIALTSEMGIEEYIE